MYAFEIASHRALRYASPLLHLIALVANLALLDHGAVYAVTLAAPAARCSPPRPSPAPCRSRRCGSPATTCW